MKITKTKLKQIIKEEVEKIREEKKFNFASHIRSYAASRPELKVWKGTSPYSEPEEGIEEIMTIGHKNADGGDNYLTIWREVQPGSMGVSFAEGNDDLPQTPQDADDILMQALYPDEWEEEYDRRHREAGTGYGTNL